MDTLAYVKRLQAAGVPREQAEAHAEALSLAADTTLATKADLKDLEIRLVKWFTFALLAQGGLVVALIKLIPA